MKEGFDSHYAHQLPISVYAPAALVAVSLGLLVPIWLLFGPHTRSAQEVDILMAACQRGLERGPLALPGFGAAAVLLLWSSVSVGRITGFGIIELFAARRVARALVTGSREMSLSAGSGTVAVRLVEAAAPFAFCSGLLRPRIYLSRSLLAQLSSAEVAAVVLHEQAHQRCWDPLRVWFVRLVSRSLLLPNQRSIAERYAAVRETTADSRSVEILGDAWPLLSAIAKVTREVPSGIGFNDRHRLGLKRLRDPRQRGAATIVWTPWTMLAFSGFLLVIAWVGLSDWHAFVFCPMQGGAP